MKIQKKKFSTGLVIGRFQPFHNGHKFLIEKALVLCDRIIIGIGSSNITDEKNPYSVETRKKFLKRFIKNENIEKKVIAIIDIADHPDDDVWLSNLLKKTGKFDISIGDNEWVNEIFEKARIPVERIGFYKRAILEGTKIRSLIIDEKKWEDRVPEYLVEQIEEI